jgi:16S rRNA C1402 N4-methylase RsmH
MPPLAAAVTPPCYLEKGGHVLGFDQDQDAIAHVRKRFNGHNNIQLVEANFIGLKTKASVINLNTSTEFCLI